MHKNIGSVLGFLGEFLVKYGLATFLSEEVPTRPIVATGGAFILGSIPFQIVYVAHSIKAINNYNNDLSEVGHRKSDVKICMAVNQRGINIAF